MLVVKSNQLLYLEKRILLISLFLFLNFVYSQELPPIQNYLPSDYQAENQNWAISQSQEGLIYVANSKGLLEFDGSVWTLYPSPNETIMRSVKVIDDKVYTGSYMEFGFWEKNQIGILTYHSLSEQIKTSLIEDEEFWTILHIDDWIVFHSLKKIYIYSTTDKSFKTINSRDVITKMFKVENRIFYQKLNEGIFKIEKGNEVIVTNDELFRKNEIINIFHHENGLLILTRDHSFYLLEDGLVKKWETQSEELLSQLSVYSAIQLNNGGFAIGTISNGLVYLNKNGELVHQIDQNNGLLNNTVLSLFEDLDHTIWLGLDNGISFINMDSPFMVFKDRSGLLGSVYASAIADGNLYLGTNQGLFYKKFGSNDEFKIIEGTEGQVWCLTNIGNSLFCGHHTGTYIVESNMVKKISNIPGAWTIKKLKDNNDLLLQGNYDGLYVLQRLNNIWTLKNKIEGFNNSSRYLEMKGSKILVNHEYKGLFKVTVDSNLTKAKEIVLDTSYKGANSSLVNFNDNILYAYQDGILKYNQEEDKFIKDSVLSKAYSKDEYVCGKMIFLEKDNELWLFTKSNLVYFSQGSLSSSPKINKIPLSYEERNEAIEYENILKLEKGKYLLGSNSGYFLIDIDEFKAKDFKVSLRKIINRVHHKKLIDNQFLDATVTGNFRHKENNFEFQFYTPKYNKFIKPVFQYQLTGLYDEWSNWSEQSSARFENLPPGNFTFNVKAKIGNNFSSNIASYNFNIDKPWYATDVMLILYGLGVILFSIFMHHVYKHYYQKEQQKLIEKNKRELELVRIQNEKEIIRIKNEKLQLDYKTKSKELAASTMSIVKKNETLAEIKERLISSSENKAVKEVLKIIDYSLNHVDNWEFFKEAFENADSEFFKHIKELHPNLSPNDLKLCAYLRLNLSSKEIAPMFNISARSVEIKRYRLRKKMDLSSDENLTNYILSL